MEWEIPEVNEFKTNGLSSQLEVTQPLARILIQRGYGAPEIAKKFLNPRFEDLRDPFDFQDMELAVKRTLAAIEQKEHILVWGHEDVDGMTATALLVKVIQDLGGIVSWHIPKGKAVGLNPKDVNEAISRGVNIIITVDCGSSALELSGGIDIIITDHHEFPKGKPASFAFLNPKLGYTFPWLAGVGVAYKLTQALAITKLKLKPHQWFSVSRKLLIFVMLGTIADRVELVDENRTLVKLGKDAASHCPIMEKIGINELIKLLGSSTILNPNPGVEFLLTESEEILSRLKVAKIEQDNKIEEAYRRCLELKSASSGIMLIYDDELDPTVIGVCTSRLMNRESVPSIIIGKMTDETLVGEARAPEGFDFIELFTKFDDIFIDWGGHKKAAGFSIPLHKLEEFKHRLSLYNFIPPEKVLKIDAEVKTDEITPQFLKEIELLEPFGPGNPKPLFLTRGIKQEVGTIPLPFDGRFDVVWTVEQSKPKLKEWREV